MTVEKCINWTTTIELGRPGVMRLRSWFRAKWVEACKTQTAMRLIQEVFVFDQMKVFPEFFF